MNHHSDRSQAHFTEPDTSIPKTSPTTLLDFVNLLRSAGRALLAQGALHSQLARLEWAQQKRRLSQLVLFTLLGFVCLISLMLVVSATLLALSWGTEFQVPVILLLILVYGIATVFAWRRVQLLMRQTEQAFAATKEELAADVALLRSRM